MYLGSTSDPLYYQLSGWFITSGTQSSVHEDHFCAGSCSFSQGPFWLLVLFISNELSGNGPVSTLCSILMVQNSLRGFHIILEQENLLVLRSFLPIYFMQTFLMCRVLEMEGWVNILGVSLNLTPDLRAHPQNRVQGSPFSRPISIYAFNSFSSTHIVQCIFITVEFNVFSNILCDFFFDVWVTQKYVCCLFSSYLGLLQISYVIDF